MSPINGVVSRVRSIPRALVQNLTGQLGLYVGKHPLPNTLPNRLRYLLGQLRINCVIDVGAHYGEYGQSLRELGYRGRIASFEPIADNYTRLAGVASRDDAWRTFPYALGSEEASKEINVLAASDLSSFLSASYTGDRFGNGLTLERRESVAVRRLDTMFSKCVEGVVDPRVLLKMDTQGYDFAVLEGASAILPQVALLQSEVSVRPLYEGMTLLPEAISHFQGLGFDLAGLYPVALELDQLRVIEFDCIMVKSGITASA